MKRILVFCGSSFGRLPEYRESATALGRLLAERGLGLVYGGARIGLMGAVADATLAAGGEVIGVIPQRLVDLEVPHRGLTELHVVQTMHERKSKMAALSDGVISLPGGIGTLDELFELFTWSQLGLHRKPLGVLDVAGYWRPLLDLVDHLVDEGFLRAAHRDTLLVDADVPRLLDRMNEYRYAGHDKWSDDPPERLDAG